jgi:hypothetical protein
MELRNSPIPESSAQYGHDIHSLPALPVSQFESTATPVSLPDLTSFPTSVTSVELAPLPTEYDPSSVPSTLALLGADKSEEYDDLESRTSKEDPLEPSQKVTLMPPDSTTNSQAQATTNDIMHTGNADVVMGEPGEEDAQGEIDEEDNLKLRQVLQTLHDYRDEEDDTGVMAEEAVDVARQ